MFVLRFRLPIPPPRRGDATWLPAGLTALLVMFLFVQLALPSPVELPEVVFDRPVRLRPPVIDQAVADPAIVTRPIFAPGRRESAAEPGTVPDRAAPLDGARAVGVMAVRGTVRAFLQDSAGRTQAIGRGEIYHGWVVIAIDSNRIAVRRGAAAATLPVTASVAPVPPAAPTNRSEDPQ